MRIYGNSISLGPRLFLFTGVLLGVLSEAAPSRAENQAFTKDRAAIAGSVGWGSQNLDLGVGGRLSYTVDPGVFFGAMFDYWFVQDQTVGFPGQGALSLSASAWNLLGVAGYDFGVSPRVVIRPFGGAGILRESIEECVPNGASNLTETCIDATGSTGVGVLGGHAVFDVDPLVLGAELRLIFLTTENAESNSNAVFTIGGFAGFSL